jgi:hypothetical protein
MEFKGTKGAWKINHTRSHICETKIVCGDIRIAEAKHYNDGQDDDWKNDPALEEGRANALLISKAPEMLEMLKDILDSVDWSDNVWVNLEGRCIENKIEKLIKEATEF